MRDVYLTMGLLGAVVMAFPLQEAIPASEIFCGARLLIVPSLVVYAGLALPAVGMLVVGVLGGFLCDLAFLHFELGRVEIGLGWSIVYFVVVGFLASGFQPFFFRGHWWVSIPLSCVAASLYLFLQFLMITFRREDIIFGEVTFWRIVGSGIFASAVAPVVHGTAWFMENRLRRRPRARESGLARR